MTENLRTCLNCQHCTRQHYKDSINTEGDYICLVLGTLIPRCFEDSLMCSDLYFDKHDDEQNSKQKPEQATQRNETARSATQRVTTHRTQRHDMPEQRKR